jgi:hypothetical protein
VKNGKSYTLLIHAYMEHSFEEIHWHYYQQQQERSSHNNNHKSIRKTWKTYTPKSVKREYSKFYLPF